MAVGMTEGHLLLLDCEIEVKVLMEARFKDIGGIWTLCGCNGDTDLAVGTIGGLFMV